MTLKRGSTFISDSRGVRIGEQDARNRPATHGSPRASLSEIQISTALAAPDRSASRQRHPRIVIDLTPVLIGGENGGAKVMAMELIRRLAGMAGDWDFILLTSENSHEELACLDAPNIRRVCASAPHALLSRADTLAIRLRRALARILPVSALSRLAGIYEAVSGAVAAGSSVVRTLKADLLFCPFTAPFYFDPTVPVVSVVHDLQYLYYPDFFEPADVQQRDRAFRQACRVATKMVCVSNSVRNSVIHSSRLPPDRVVTVYTSLSHRLPEPSYATRQRVLGACGLTGGRFLLYPANFWPHKNHELLLTAFNIYRAAHAGSDLKLALTGAPGPRRDELIEARRKMGLSEAVVFPGYLPNEEFAVLMACCQAVIFPSLFEGFGMPLLEAMAAGRPVLCGKATSLPEIAGDAALLFDARKPAEIVDAISRIEDDPELRSDLAAKSKERLAFFGAADRMAAEYLRIFSEAMATPADFAAELYGAFEDGWIGERLTAVFGRGSQPRHLTVRLSAPGWIPFDALTVRVVADGADTDRKHTLKRGESIAITHPLGEASGSVDLFCSPTFQPKSCGMGDDTRLLACHLQSAELVAADGEKIQLGLGAAFHAA